jgi:hypothetical protein
MRRVIVLVIAVLTLSAVIPGMVGAQATRTEFTGSFDATATWPGDIRILESGIMLQVGAEASGPIVCDDPRLTGTLAIVLNVVFNLNTGNGNAFGTFTVSNADGTFEGKFENRDTSYVLYTGIAQGHGTGAYEGLLVKFRMEGLDWYRDADPATNGITGDCTGYIVSPHGV